MPTRSTRAAASRYALSKSAWRRLPRFFCTNGAPEALTPSSRFGVSCTSRLLSCIEIEVTSVASKSYEKLMILALGSIASMSLLSDVFQSRWAPQRELCRAKYTCIGVAPGSFGVAGDTKGGVIIAGVLPRALCAICTELASTSACNRTIPEIRTPDHLD